MSDRSYRRRVEELVFNKKLDESLDLTEGNKKTKEKLKAYLRDVGSKAQGLGTAHRKRGETNTSPSYLLRRGRAEAQKGAITQEPMPGRITAIQYRKRKAAKEREDESGGVVGRDRILEIAKVEILSRAIVEEVEALYEQGKIDESALGKGTELLGLGVKRLVGSPFRAIGGLAHGFANKNVGSKGSISHALGRRIGSGARGLARGILRKSPEETDSMSNKIGYNIGKAPGDFAKFVKNIPNQIQRGKWRKEEYEKALKKRADRLKAAANSNSSQPPQPPQPPQPSQNSNPNPPNPPNPVRKRRNPKTPKLVPPSPNPNPPTIVPPSPNPNPLRIVTSNDMTSDYVSQKYQRIDELLPLLMAAAPWVLRAAPLIARGIASYGAKEVAKQGIKQGIKHGAGQFAKSAGKQILKQGVKQGVKGLAKDQLKSQFKANLKGLGDMVSTGMGTAGSNFMKGVKAFKTGSNVAKYASSDEEKKKNNKQDQQDDTRQEEPTQDDSYRY